MYRNMAETTLCISKISLSRLPLSNRALGNVPKWERLHFSASLGATAGHVKSGQPDTDRHTGYGFPGDLLKGRNLIWVVGGSCLALHLFLLPAA